MILRRSGGDKPCVAVFIPGYPTLVVAHLYNSGSVRLTRRSTVTISLIYLWDSGQACFGTDTVIRPGPINPIGTDYGRHSLGTPPTDIHVNHNGHQPGFANESP